MQERGGEIAGLVVLREQLPGEIGVPFRVRVFGLATQRFIESQGRLVPPQQGLEQLAAEKMIRGFVRNLSDRVVHLRQRIVELAIFQEPLRFGVKGRCGSA